MCAAPVSYLGGWGGAQRVISTLYSNSNGEKKGLTSF